MSNNTFSSYNTANSIDASADYLLISPSNSNIYKRINRNTLLALASAPLGLTDIQSPQNKTFDNTNSLTVKDGSLTIQNTSSTTKQAVFSAAGITAGQTRTFTFPDASGTLATLAGTQTLTNKTITSPTITGGTIDNSTITVDSIAGHTSGTTVTVANLQIVNGVLNSANAVTSASVAAGAIQPQTLTSGTGTGWAYTSYTPTLANLTLGNGTITSKYIQIGKTVQGYFLFVLGTTSAVAAGPTFTLPVTAASSMISGSIGMHFPAFGFDTGGGNVYDITARMTSTTVVTLFAKVASTSYVSQGTLNSTTPFTWGNTSAMGVNFTYEAA